MPPSPSMPVAPLCRIRDRFSLLPAEGAAAGKAGSSPSPPRDPFPKTGHSHGNDRAGEVAGWGVRKSHGGRGEASTGVGFHWALFVFREPRGGAARSGRSTARLPGFGPTLPLQLGDLWADGELTSERVMVKKMALTSNVTPARTGRQGHRPLCTVFAASMESG